jgi:hypothetical protein
VPNSKVNEVCGFANDGSGGLKPVDAFFKQLYCQPKLKTLQAPHLMQISCLKVISLMLPQA